VSASFQPRRALSTNLGQHSSISLRTLNFDSTVILPIVTFTGSVVGSGRTLLRGDPPSGLSETQQKCCGFVQLSTFITPGNSTRPPYRRAHQFQVFVIFPIHVNPWMIRCKKMVERPNTQFQPNALFHCTGRLAGFLDHRIMVHPPSLAQDYVFIIVPENWDFFAKSSKNTISTASPIASTAKQSSADPRSQFMSPKKRKADQLSDPETPQTLPDRGANMTISSREKSPKLPYRTLTRLLAQTPATSHTTNVSGVLASPPHKRPRAENIQPTSPHTTTPSATTPYTSPYTLPNTPANSDNWSRTSYAAKSQPPRPQPAFTTNQLPQSATQPPAVPPDDRPHRNRQPTKKVLNID